MVELPIPNPPERPSWALSCSLPFLIALKWYSFLVWFTVAIRNPQITPQACTKSLHLWNEAALCPKPACIFLQQQVAERHNPQSCDLIHSFQTCRKKVFLGVFLSLQGALQELGCWHFFWLCQLSWMSVHGRKPTQHTRCYQTSPLSPWESESGSSYVKVWRDWTFCCLLLPIFAAQNEPCAGITAKLAGPPQPPVHVCSLLLCFYLSMLSCR